MKNAIERYEQKVKETVAAINKCAAEDFMSMSTSEFELAKKLLELSDASYKLNLMYMKKIDEMDEKLDKMNGNIEILLER